ncbi:oxidoreductase [Sphaerisporangium melleum]|uniref:Oxidoreductase n=1 Tax=Sphaerisporangium melleum TaxID=321316 RepID=A0A917QT48_9ACTN|nr:oxidoreductase [Sphaerisporangium melleum]GGK65876.1 oxidoreductase [Sphaerisporangium melleum]GII69904.1 oxidoreductase [Sphaerisporangium melleum]
MSQESKPAATAGRIQPANGLSVNRLGYGAMQLPGPMIWGPPADKDTALAVLCRAVELGVDHIDTSDAYGPHIANELIREALHPYPENLVIATKVGVVRDEYKTFNAEAGPQALRDQVEENLSTLGLARLDLVYLRVGGDGMLFPGETPFEESFGALVQLQERGLIRNLGLSGVTVDQLEKAREMAPVAFVQNRFHLLDRGALDVLRYCEDHDIAFAPYFPMVSGMLNPGIDKSQLPPGLRVTDDQEKALDAIAARHGATRAQIALAWLLAVSPATVLIPGTKSVAHLEENLRAGLIELTGDDIAELDKFA